jgi:4-aminobutyrate aminotransferase-like enzyme
VVQGEGLQDNARSVGRQFRSGLDDLASRHPHLGSIRSAGLFLGVDIVTDGAPDAEKTGRIVNALREARVLISATGPQGHVLKIRPPLVFSAQNVDFFLDRFDRVLRATD